MIPALQALVALQQIDTAADAARRRQQELPAAEARIAELVAVAEAAVAAAKTRLADNQAARRALEKDVALVDSRLARFDDHKAAVKTNQEYTALLHEIEIARGDKDAIEDKILLLMEEADAITAEIDAAETAVADAATRGQTVRAELAAEARALDETIARLETSRKGEIAGLDAATLARYEQLLRQRKGVAVAALTGETCSACFVRLRPNVTQQIRRNDAIVQCESCQRILFYVPPPDQAGTG